MSETVDQLRDEVLDSLQDVNYPHFKTIDSNVSLLTDLKTFSSIISWISDQLRAIEGFEGLVNPIQEESDFVSFKIELNSLLREMDCPLMDSSFTEPFNRLAILNSLCGQLLSSRMNYVNQKMGSNNSMTITLNESQTTRDLKAMSTTLGFGKPPKGLTSEALFRNIKHKVMDRLSQNHRTIEDSLLLPEGLTLSPDQWKTLEVLNEELKRDYKIRREMLLRRCDCTVGSFTWKSDNSNETTKQINDLYHKERQLLSTEPNVCLADGLAARQSDCDLLINGVISKCPTNCLIQVPKTTGTANSGVQQLKQVEELHKYRIGLVPDRGGRPGEQPAPPKETFGQQQFQRDNPQRGRGRGGNTGNSSNFSRGGSAPNMPQNTGRIQGRGWTQNTGDRYNSGSGGYDQQKRGYQQNYDNFQTGGQYHQQRDNQYNASNQYKSQNNRSSDYQNSQYYEQPMNNNNYYSEQSFYGNNRQQQQYSGGHRGRGGGSDGRRY